MSNQPQDIDYVDETVRESYRERTARMRAVALLANRLIALKPAQLAAMALPTELAEAVVACQGFKKNARARQLRRIGGLLRASDLPPIEAAMLEIQTGRGERSRREQGYEQWRVRLLEGGDPAMTEFVAAHPGADVQGLRQRVRIVLREPASPRGKTAARELLRSIRALQQAAMVPSDSPPPNEGDEPGESDEATPSDEPGDDDEPEADSDSDD